MLKRILAALVAVMILLAAPAAAGGPEVETGNRPAPPAAPAAPGQYCPPGPQGPRGYQGPVGPQGPAGHTPTPAEVEAAVRRYLDSDANHPPSAWAKPALEEMVADGFVVGYPGGAYRWRAPATREEVAAIVARVWGQTQRELKRLNDRVEAVETVNARQDGEIGQLRQTDLDQGDINVALVFLAFCTALAAAAFGLFAAVFIN